MWKTTLVAIAALLVVAPVAGTIPTDDAPFTNNDSAEEELTAKNAAPLVDAGLDQTVSRGATVLLDGTESRDPDGRIDRYSWSIQTPDGRTVTPDCADCARTEFTPSETGRYRVTLTVTDDDGATRSDTLYVDVSPGTSPSISLSGPRQPTEGSSATYTASLTAGDAALDYVVWTVDGTEITNHSLSATQETDTATKHFPTAGDRTISATVYDADGQSATSSVSVAVQEKQDPPSNRSHGNDSSGTGGTIADRHDPMVTGDELVTGTEPLDGSYEVQLDAPVESVDSVEWQDVAGRIGSGRSLTKQWEPGDHQLYAVVTYTDGSENVATFSDGNTTVTADPKPNVSVGSLNRYGTISGTPIGTDEYENLDTLRVEIDGKTVATASSSVRGRHGLDFDRQRSVSLSYDDFTPGERSSVSVVAIDDRGQTTRVSREIVPVKEPEIARSEFVNGPVDSYHERLDPSRYAAHHVLEIDLNGVKPENMSIIIKGNTVGTKNLEKGDYSIERTYKQSVGSIEVNSFWRGSSPGDYEIRYKYRVKNGAKSWKYEGKKRFRVTPSKPELRLDVLNDGTKEYITREHGILVNASNSFDPDGTDLKYIWKYGAEPTKPDNTTAKFRAYERASSIVEDEYDLRAKENLDFLAYFVPDIERTSVSTSEPYFPNETVQVQVETNAYHFSKQTYYDDFSLGLKISNQEAKVLQWDQVEAPDSAHSEPTEDAYRYEAVIEIPASELSPGSGTPTITVYNKENKRKTVQTDIPDVNVLVEDRTYWDNVTITNLTYTVEKPDVHEVTAGSGEERDEYLDSGYSVETTERETEHVLEKRVKVSDAEYEKMTRTFESDTIRDMFLDGQSDWYRSGTTEEEVTRTEMNDRWYGANTVESTSRWHDSDYTNGESTGHSREVLVEEAVYQTQWQYQYDYEIEKTGTRTITRTRTVKVPRTGTRTVTKCTVKFGCQTRTETYTYYVTRTYTYTTTDTYTYTVTQTKTYWAGENLRNGHETTGKTRHVKLKDAVYETERKVRYKSQYTETVTHYVAASDNMTEPAEYEWQETQTTNNSMLARRQASNNEDWRIGETTTDKTWVLVKHNGTVQFVTSKYVNASRVVETSATLEGDLIQQYHNIETGGKVTKEVEERTKQEIFEGAKGREEIVDEVTESEEKDDECKLKGLC